MATTGPRAATDADAAVRAACAAGDRDLAATRALDHLGDEILAYLVATGRSEADGSDAFSIFAERLWRSLPEFRWESSLRTWCYLLARRALAEVKRAGPNRRARRAVPLSQAPAISELAAAVRTRTLPHLRTSARDAFAELRASLDSVDAELLILRIDRRLPWRDVARVLGDGEDLDAAALDRRSAALRKRFEVLKVRLRAVMAAVRDEE
jgi:RNA polymerase sigma-70 factor (ECF subfamily)